MHRIDLTRGKCALVSVEDFEYINSFKWTATMNTDKRDSSRIKEKWYAVRNYRGKRIYMHRFIMKAKKGTLVDHLDGDGLNNMRTNLRIVNHRQNNAHLSKFKKTEEYKNG